MNNESSQPKPEESNNQIVNPNPEQKEDTSVNKENQINQTKEENQNNTKERDLHISRLESEMAILRKKDQEKDQYIASLESAFYKLREEIISKSADDKHPEEAVMHPVTPPPMVNKEVPQPTNKNPKDYTSNI